MARKGLTEEQIGFALRQAESGRPVAEICRKAGATTIEEISMVPWTRSSSAWCPAGPQRAARTTRGVSVRPAA